MLVVEFDVIRPLKGDLRKKVTLETSIHEGVCGVHFDVGAYYFALASRTDGMLQTDLCFFNSQVFPTQLDEAEREFHRLHGRRSPSTR